MLINRKRTIHGTIIGLELSTNILLKLLKHTYLLLVVGGNGYIHIYRVGPLRTNDASMYVSEIYAMIRGSSQVRTI